MVAVPARRTRRLTGSTAPAFARHVAIVVLAAAATYGLATVAPPQDQPAMWIVGGLAAGLIASFLARGAVGFTVLVLGVLLGIGILYQWRAEGWPSPDQLIATAAVYLTAVAAAGLAYALGRVGRLT